jgi:outer membrane receptor for ferrienterochelin and colicin
MKNYFILLVIVIMAILPLEASQSFGTVQGKVSEEQGNRPITGVLVRLMDTELSTLSNEEGEYKLLQVPVGNYRIKFSYASFETIIKTDIIVRPNRITYLDVKMREDLPWVKETVTVEESYFHKDIEIPTSTVKISAEEIRRTPGTAGFVSRTITVLPGVSFAGGDENTDLLVRGGSPDENGFFIDNIEVPNINHLPRLISSGGAFSAVNPDLLQNLEFYSGAFSADYGDRLSSITNITLREGNRNEVDGEFDINIFMAGMVMEGPISKGKGSWLIAGRKSYVKLLNDIGILDELGDTLGTIDSQLKLTYDFSPKHKINILNLLATGSFRDFHANDTIEDNFYTQNTFGINLKSIWNNNFFSNTSLSFSFLKRTDTEAFPVNARDFYWKCKDLARYFALRNSNFLFFKNKNKLEFGVQIKHERDDINFYEHQYYTSTGEFFPTWSMDFDYNTTKFTLYLSFAWNLYKRFSTTIGLRGDYSSTHKVFHLSPRISASIHLSKKLSINAGYGIFYQTVPMRFMTFYERHRHLKDTNAVHYNLGIEYINGGTKLTLEAFEKKYKNLLLDPSNPLFLATENGLDEYYYPPVLLDIGRGYARGIELLIHKKLVKRFHGLFSLTIFKSRYTDLDGIWRNSGYETPFIINFLAGYKPNSLWEFGLRLTLIGGKPYTPIDEGLSYFYGTEIFDITRFNEERYPTYSKLNLRVERRFFFSRSNLVIYLDIWNALNKVNIYEYNWADDPDEHLPIVPVLGFKFEF